MKLLHAKVLVMFYLFYIDATFQETIEITRRMPSKWKDGAIDSFQLPQSVCYQESSGYGNYCNSSLGTCTKVIKDETENQDRYLCDCSKDNATVTYLNNKWRCLGNQEAREQLGCEVNNLLFEENEGDRLRTLDTGKRRRTKLNNGKASCAINISSSWYIGCFGGKIPLVQYTNITKEIFLLSIRSGVYRIEVKNVQPAVKIFRGRVINLGVRCSGPPIEEGCLLFKLEGRLSCHVERPTEPIFSSTINLTLSNSSLEILSPSMTIFKTTTGLSSIRPTQAYSGKATSPATNGPIQATASPSSGRKQKNEADSSSSPLGIIAGVTASGTLLLLLIAAFFIYRRRKSRNHKSSASGQIDKKTAARNPKANLAFKLEEKNGYVTNHDKKPIATVYSPSYDVPHQQTVSSEKNSPSGGLYAALNIPEVHNIYGPRDSQVKMSQNYDSSSVNQPVYNEPELVYNVLEEPYAAVSEEPGWYGSAPVDGPVYNTLEEPDQYADSTYKNEPLYNVLEGPDQGGAEEDDSYGPKGFQLDPVYNVLEGPDPESGKDGLHSNNAVRQDPGSCNTYIPVYAVVNEKKKMTR